MRDTAVVTSKGARRWTVGASSARSNGAGHPWIFRSDISRRPSGPAGAVTVLDPRGKELGCALWSPRSEIALRMLDSDAGATLDEKWWMNRIAAALARRAALASETNAFRVVHGEGDTLPSLVCDKYGEWLVVQLLSAGLETFREEIVAALQELLSPRGILARNDVAVREKEGLPRTVELLSGDVPRDIEIHENGIRYLAAPWDGQKTGAFLDQRENRVLIGSLARGAALDCFSYHGSFALHLARKATSVVALDSSRPALERAMQNARLNGFTNLETVESDVFDYLRDAERAQLSFDTIVLDPPAFAKNRSALSAAVRGYKEINLRAMRLLSRGGLLFTASCSFHLSRTDFFAMLAAAANDSERRIALREIRGQSMDHPEVFGIPETGYLKGALLEALD